MRLKTIPCPGEAHRNPFIDDCHACAPLWGEMVVIEPSDPAAGNACLAAFKRAKAKFLRVRKAALGVLEANASKCCDNPEGRCELASAIASEPSRGAK